MKHLWFPILIGLLVGWHIRGRVREAPCPPCNQLTAVDTVYASRVDTVTKGVPAPFKVVEFDHLALHDTIFIKTIARNFDTSAILADYLATRHYSDTFGDSTYKIWLRESVSGNRITSRELLFQNLRATVINHYTPAETWHLYLGGYYTTSPGFCAEYQKGPWAFEAGFDLNKTPLVGVKYKVK